MGSVSCSSLVILNPASAAGSTGRHRTRILERVTSLLGPVDCEETQAPGDAARIAREAAKRGVERILVAGGDGTTGEIASGLLEPPGVASPPPLGLLPLGSGWDLARSLELPRDLDEALAVIDQGHRRRIDAGRAVVATTDSRRRSSCFVNEVSVGLSSVTVERVGAFAKRVGPRLGFLAGAVSAIATHHPFVARVEVDGVAVYEGPVSMIVGGNGAYFGAGMRVAPQAKVDDGRLSVVLVRGLSVPRLLRNLPSIYEGRHATHPSVSFHSGHMLEVFPDRETAPVENDGESIGVLPLRAEIVPGALEIFTPKAGYA